MEVRTRAILCVIVWTAATGWVAPVSAQEPPQPAAHDVTELAKKTQNPVGDLIGIPFQFNFNTGGDLEDRTFLNLNFQPVIPFWLTENWHAIGRTIVGSGGSHRS